MANDNDDSTSPAITAGAIGGGALLLWWLLRGRGRGLGGGGESGGAVAPAAHVLPSPAPVPAGPPCSVFLRGTSIELNGAASDLTATVAACREAGTAHLRASGDTTTRAVMQVARALNAAGVATLAHGDIADAVRDALTRTA